MTVIDTSTSRERCHGDAGEAEGFDKTILRSHMPIVFDLGSDPGESYNLFNDKMDIGWEAAVVLPVVYEYEKSFGHYPNIKPGEEFTGYPASIPPASH
jgi:hypothetical protein